VDLLSIDDAGTDMHCKNDSQYWPKLGNFLGEILAGWTLLARNTLPTNTHKSTHTSNKKMKSSSFILSLLLFLLFPTTIYGCTFSFPYSYGFEDPSDLGGWANGAGNSGWTLGSGSTPTSGTGPSSAAEGQYYLYAEASGSPTGKEFTSQCLPLVDLSQPQLRFQYHMWSDDTTAANSELVVEARVNAFNTAWSVLWSITGNQGNAWYQAIVDLPDDNNYLIRFRANTAGVVDIGIDDVILSEAMPTSMPSSTPTVSPTFVPTFTAAPSTTPTPGPTSTPSFMPTAMPTKEPSSMPSLYPSDMPSMIPTTIPSGMPSSYPSDMPSMIPTTMPSRMPSSKPTASPTTTPTAIPTTASPTFEDCIALPHTFGFESGFGDWYNVFADDDFDWTIQEGGTPTSGTGPSGAAVGSKYAYMEVSPFYPTKVAVLLGGCFDFTSIPGPTLSFQYHMFGPFIGTLTLSASMDEGATWMDVWTQTGPAGVDEWQTATIEFTDIFAVRGERTLLRFLGVSSFGYTGDIAIDDISIATKSS